jgi:hypothetical protein
MGEKHRGSEGNQRPDPVPPYAPEGGFAPRLNFCPARSLILSGKF